jgi:hypothetical protein
LYDNIRAEWGLPEGSTSSIEEGKRPRAVGEIQRGPEMEGENQVIQVKCAPKEWPLFSAPGLSSMRVVGYKEKGGTLVSVCTCTAFILRGIFVWPVDNISIRMYQGGGFGK